MWPSSQKQTRRSNVFYNVASRYTTVSRHIGNNGVITCGLRACEHGV